MFAGVIRDEQRTSAKRAEREQRERDFQEQIRRREYLEKQQSVSHASEYSKTPLPPNAPPVSDVEFQGCKTC